MILNVFNIKIYSDDAYINTLHNHIKYTIIYKW
jgi:hypothetical protein